MPRALTYTEFNQAALHYLTAHKLAGEMSTCNEARFGAVIFNGERILASGVNHVPEYLRGASCDDCPRKAIAEQLRKERGIELKGGVGAEICFAIHAEEDAANNFLKMPQEFREQYGPGAHMIVAWLKGSIPKVKTPEDSVRCTICARRVISTNIAGVIMPMSDPTPGIFGTLVEFTPEEFVRLSYQNLNLHWEQALLKTDAK